MECRVRSVKCGVWSVECSVWNVIACHNMPRLPRDLQRVTTSRSRDNAIRKNTQSDTSEVLRPPRKITMEGSKVLRLPRTMQLILKAFQSIAPVKQNYYRRVCRHVRMSGSVTPATQEDISTCFGLQKG